MQFVGLGCEFFTYSPPKPLFYKSFDRVYPSYLKGICLFCMLVLQSVMLYSHNSR